MTVALITHPDCLLHDPGAGHPESPARLRAVLQALDAPEFAALHRVEARLADTASIQAVHPGPYWSDLAAAEPAPGGQTHIDADTHLNHGSIAAALRAAGGAIAAVDEVLSGRARFAFAAVRPPGHHAEPATAMGFCLINNVAVAAAHARAHWGLTRIAVLDFDVHHGNGTQAAFHDDPALFYASTHQSPCYPGTGAVSETGVSHNIVNRPLRPGAGSAAFRSAWIDILSRLTTFAPDLVIVSAGFDAHHADPLAALELTEADFAWAATTLLAAGHTRLASVLEGGYDLPALAGSVAAWLRVLLQEDTRLG